MTKAILTAAALLLSAIPAFAQTKPLTPPDVLGAAKTIQFTVTLYRVGDPAGFYLVGHNMTALQVSDVILAQPNKAYIVANDVKTKTVNIAYVSNGKMQIEYSASRKRTVRSGAPAQIGGVDFRTFGLSAFANCLAHESFAKFKDMGEVGFGKNLLNHCYLLPLGIVNGEQAYEAVVVDHKTGLPVSASISRGAHTPGEFGGNYIELRETVRLEFSHWKLNAPVDDSKFAYTPPVGGIRN